MQQRYLIDVKLYLKKCFSYTFPWLEFQPSNPYLTGQRRRLPYIELHNYSQIYF